LAQIFDFAFTRFKGLGLAQRPYIAHSAAALFVAASIVAFTIFAPLIYGNQWTQSECKRVKVFDTWDWDCATFHTSVG
jgi:dolichyl-phosphate-mannose-protein mannosyltransferase